jgi:hypothetical protein
MNASPDRHDPPVSIQLSRPLVVLLAGGLLAAGLVSGCEDEEDFSHLTPCADITGYHDRAGICSADDPLVSFMAGLNDETPLILEESGLKTYAVLPDCSVRELSIEPARIIYEQEPKPRLLLRLNDLEGEVTLEELRQDSYLLQGDYLALQVVRVSATEISGAVFVRYPHSSTPIEPTDPRNWIIDTALVAPEDRPDWQPETANDEQTATFQQLVGTPELANLERFLLALIGGEINNYALTIQGRYTGDYTVAEGESFYAPYPDTPAESSRVSEHAREVIERFYLGAPGWRVANHLYVEALDWEDRYLANLGERLFGREIGLRLTWTDPASGTICYQVEDTVGLVRWVSDGKWYVDTDRIHRRVLERPENRLWLGVAPPEGLAEMPREFSSSDDLSSLSEEEYWGMLAAPNAADDEDEAADAEGGGEDTVDESADPDGAGS